MHHKFLYFLPPPLPPTNIMRGVWVKSTLAGLVGIQWPRTRPPMHTYGLNSVLRSIWWGAERSCSQSSGNLAFTWKPRVSEETSSLCRQYFVKDGPETADSDYEPSGFMESTASAWQISVMQGQLKRSNTSPCSQSKHECLATRKKSLISMNFYWNEFRRF